MTDMIIFAFEIVGVVAFAISGALVGIKKKMDILGISILGLLVACGGGVIRDLVLGITPPMTFRNPIYATIAILTSIVVFIYMENAPKKRSRKMQDRIMLIMDAIGLGIFTVMGINTAYTQEQDYSWFLLIFVGVITGVGGGILRDIMAGDRPYVFVKHFYASASIIGAIVYVIILP
jgi:uncharacterized membrane protein YeiH